MRSQPHRLISPDRFRRRLERLDGLPFRASTVREILGPSPDETLDSPDTSLNPADIGGAADLDPGWALERVLLAPATDPLALVGDRPWWPRPTDAGAAALLHLWRHAVAVARSARRLAREGGDPDPEQLARIGLLHGLGRWVVAATEPDWLADWITEPDPRARLDLERRSLGIELTALGRHMAERWGCDPLLVDAAWLHADRDTGLNALAADRRRLALIQEAYAWAERTPWALSAPEVREPTPTDPVSRVLMAEVQARCGSAFVEPDANLHEQRMARSSARLLLRLRQLRQNQAASERFLQTFADADPTDGPEAWAECAGLAWCGEPGVSAARVVWAGAETIADGLESAERSPARRLSLGRHGRAGAEVHLWGEGVAGFALDTNPLWTAWQAWARLVADRAMLSDRLDAAVRALRERVASEEPALRQAKLEALAEFAAGAGHELNNPLAVILGRAQLLLAQETDAGVVRSLRAILGQAQRAHRILRDLMYVARPTEPRPRFCHPDEIVRNALRDFKPEAEARGLRLSAEGTETGSRVWADHDALRHLLDLLIRNALEATPKGGKIQVSTAWDADGLRLAVQDSGRGITATEGRHLFDPFFCGRQAGRGLGLGLPRAARIVRQAGGELRWHSAPGQGSIFQVHIPLSAPPEPPRPELPPAQSPSRSETPEAISSAKLTNER